MARRKPVAASMEPAKPAAPSLPEQDMQCDPWPIVSDPEVAIAEIAKGVHDAHLDILQHVAKSQSLTSILAACWDRRSILTGS